ncbi:hypothetical protein PVAP13_6KG396506 [Panicum virgatum]|uniref:Uncharacterized protein n=1 Tax=Panicum virgatum TaxID=38727 RepID=A0A8T0RH31_PANVG|nr:hypothetical protein PVAP13_6KG396506 [Panicum virgatum]
MARPFPCSAPPLSCSGRCGVRGSGRRGRTGGEQGPLLGEASTSVTASPSPAVEEGRPSPAPGGAGSADPGGGEDRRRAGPPSRRIAARPPPARLRRPRRPPHHRQ